MENSAVLIYMCNKEIIKDPATPNASLHSFVNISILKTALISQSDVANYAWLPPFCCRSPFPLAVAVSVHLCRCCCRCRCVSFCCLRLKRNGKLFSYVIFTEQRNFTTAERRNGNGRTATEWWKPAIICGMTACHL